MNARDELEDIVARRGGHVKSTARDILAAGYRKPRTITTAEELDALAVGTIILDSDPDCCVKNEHGRWRSMSEPEDTYSSLNIRGSLPATVIYEGDAA